MRIVFMGSASFAVPSLEALVASRHPVAVVVAQPDKPAGRGRKLASCAVATAARRHRLELFQPASLKPSEAIEKIRSFAPELIAVVAYGKILPKSLLDLPPFGCVNVHASLLPKYRGAAPIAWAIAKGEKESGVTTQRIVEELDAGDVLLSRRTAIGEEETAGQLHDRLAAMGAELLLETIEGAEQGTLRPLPQDHAQASFARRLRKEDGLIGWSRPAEEIFNRIRGFALWPGSFTTLEGKKLRVLAAAVTASPSVAPPGAVIGSGRAFVVACGSGALELLEVQLEGKKAMPVSEFLRGHAVATGMILGAGEEGRSS